MELGSLTLALSTAIYTSDFAIQSFIDSRCNHALVNIVTMHRNDKNKANYFSQYTGIFILFLSSYFYM